MQYKTVDAVISKKRPLASKKGVSIPVRVARVAVHSVQYSPAVQHDQAPSSAIFALRYIQRFSLHIVLALMVISFSTGLWVMWQSDISFAEDKANLPAPAETPAGAVPITLNGKVLGTVAQLPNAEYFNMSLEQLEYYVTEGYKTPEMREAQHQAAILTQRTGGLRAYLLTRKSPLADIVDTLASLKHWRLVLAISNSESSLGKRCADNNCSGIGVEPGHPLWREYNSKAEWAQDLDRLIEKRYKDWSLEEMNGVYNYPGSENWLFAARQVLDELKIIE